jgi:hypothetical protein
MQYLKQSLEDIADYIVLRAKELDKNIYWCTSLVIHFSQNEIEEEKLRRLINEKFGK